MRDFIVYANMPVKPTFQLDDLPGSGRVDLLARCVSSALWLSHSVRRDTCVHLCVEVEGRKTFITFSGARIRRVSPDERNIASWIRRALECLAEGREKVQEGVTVQKRGLQDFVRGFGGRDIIILKEDGADIRDACPENRVFILGDHLDLPEDALKELKPFRPGAVSVGPQSLLASHAIILAHNEMDRKAAAPMPCNMRAKKA